MDEWMNRWIDKSMNGLMSDQVYQGILMSEWINKSL